MKAAMFDMDGTLYYSEYIAIPAFKETFAELNNMGLYTGPVPTDDVLLHQLGKTLDKIWEELLPGTTLETRQKADQIMLDKEIELIKEGKSVFYPDVEATLRLIKNKGYDIFVMSNGLEEYIDAIVKYSGFAELFTDLYSAGRFQTKSKSDLVAKLLKDYPNYTEIYMIGDRSSDVQSGLDNDIPVIGCLFGYGNLDELKGSKYLVENFKSIGDLLP